MKISYLSSHFAFHHTLFNDITQGNQFMIFFQKEKDQLETEAVIYMNITCYKNQSI